MTSKRQNVLGFVTAGTAKKFGGGKTVVEKTDTGKVVKENAYPKVLKGEKLEQLPMHPKLLAVASKRRQAGAKVAPSDLKKVLAGLKARKPTIG